MSNVYGGATSYGVKGYGMGHGGCGGFSSAAAIILVLFILLVIVTRGVLC